MESFIFFMVGIFTIVTVIGTIIGCLPNKSMEDLEKKISDHDFSSSKKD